LANHYFSIIFETSEGKKIMTANPAATILQILHETVAVPKLVRPKKDPFENLVLTIISQNTTDINTARAFENLSKQFEITPQVLSKAQTSRIELCLHVCGLYKNKAKTIQTVSNIILEKYNGSLASVLSLPIDEARKTLTELPGFGPKTADVVLLFSANQPTIPVDTHVNLVAKRLGLAPTNGNYEAVRLSLQSLFKPKDYLAVHLLLISHGRKYCKARQPHCQECPLNNHCPSKV
jgi:endonuclease-3